MRLAKNIMLKTIVRILGLATRYVNCIRILTYHSIQEHKNIRAHMPPIVFEKHIRYLSENGYRSLRIADIADHWPNSLTDLPAVALTFDDGLCNNWTNACQILSKYNMKGTFFIPTAYIRESRQAPKAPEMFPYQDTAMLSWSDLQEMARAGFEIGTHSHTHVIIAKHDRERAIEEITRPKKILEEKLGIAIRSFAYPKGHSDSFAEWTRDLLREAGYSVACTQVGGPLGANTDLLELPRQGINGADTVTELKLKLHGYYDCLRWIRRHP